MGKLLDVPAPRRAWAGDDGIGAVALLADASFRMTGVSERVWQFNVSGYPLLYKWLKARSGEPMHGERGAELLQEALDVAWRIEELLALFDQADGVLANVLDQSLIREDFGLPPRNAQVANEDHDEPA